MKKLLFICFTFILLYGSTQSDNALKEGDFQKAFEILSNEAKNGDAEAKFNLALMYYNGDGVDQNLSKTAQLLEESAQASFAPAVENVGRIYMQLIQFDKALPWLKINAQNGDTAAYYLLAEIYIEKENFKEAKIWAQKAIQSGNIDAQDIWNRYNLEKY